MAKSFAVLTQKIIEIKVLILPSIMFRWFPCVSAGITEEYRAGFNNRVFPAHTWIDWIWFNLNIQIKYGFETSPPKSIEIPQELLSE